MSVKAILTEQQKSYTKAEEDALLANKVPTTRTINNKVLNTDITLTTSDIGAAEEGLGVRYLTCGTAAGIQEKTISLSAITSIYVGLKLRIAFSNAQTYNGTPTLSINTFGAYDIYRQTGVPAGQYEWQAGEVLDLVFNSANHWVISGRAHASTMYPGITSLNNSTSSTSETEAATPSAVKAAYDLANSKTANSPYTSNPTMNGTASAGSNANYSRGDHVHPTDTSRLPINGQGTNLLRNWYFIGGGTGDGIFPINNRRQSSYSGTNYAINGWRGNNNYGSCTLISTGITITGANNYHSIDQTIPNIEFLNGKKLTLSALLSTGEFLALTVTFNTSSSTGTIQSKTDQTSSGLIMLFWDATNRKLITSLRGFAGKSLTFLAAKLELGTEQTLCHNEGTIETPVWVLNEVPNYEKEYYRCITSDIDSNDTYANQSLATEQQIAYIETANTASKNYVNGEYFCWNGLLYTALGSINYGTAFAINSNCKQVTVGSFMQDHAFPKSYSIELAAGKKVTISPSSEFKFTGWITSNSNMADLVGSPYYCRYYDQREGFHSISSIGTPPAKLTITNPVGCFIIENTHASGGVHLNILILGSSNPSGELNFTIT